MRFRSIFKRNRLSKLVEARKEAIERLRLARERGDTREVHRAQAAATRANHALMRATL